MHFNKFAPGSCQAQPESWLSRGIKALLKGTMIIFSGALVIYNLQAHLSSVNCETFRNTETL